ncbi:MAG: hypothetical protein A2139_04210 [Desulfobacca sp. RBG_16_60_12]|nr:MAG: hypothetical protein A2139_04210 [Desulfobacca sp. RBG_16_60_12]
MEFLEIGDASFQRGFFGQNSCAHKTYFTITRGTFLEWLARIQRGNAAEAARRRLTATPAFFLIKWPPKFQKALARSRLNH